MIYLGANQDAIAEGAKFGTSTSNSMTFGMQQMGFAMNSATRSAKLYSSGATAAASAFTDDERKGAKGAKR